MCACAEPGVGGFYDWDAAVDIHEVTRPAGTIDRWSDEVLAYSHTGRASSGPGEAVNGESEQVDRAARGFRNFHTYRTRMLLNSIHTGAGAVLDPTNGRRQRCLPIYNRQDNLEWMLRRRS